MSQKASKTKTEDDYDDDNDYDSMIGKTMKPMVTKLTQAL